MNILILGGKGNLGQQLVKVFSNIDGDLISWDKDDVNALDADLLKEKILELHPNIIVNTIAYNNVDKCEEKDQYSMALSLNTELPRILSDLAMSIGAILVHYSSDYVFSGTSQKQEFIEDDVPNPVNKYGETKFLGEQEIIKRVSKGLKYYLIRTSKLFGPSGSSDLSKNSFFDVILNLFKNNKELRIIDGELSCFTYTLDLAKYTKKLIDDKQDFGIYHIVNSKPATWYEGAVKLFKLKKINVNIKAIRSEDLSRLARRPSFSVLKNTKLRKIRSWEEALQEYICEE